MKQTLATSEAKQFEYLMVGDEVVVRNYKKILAFFTVHFSDHPIGIREILALPEFYGPKADEKIQWTTELFETTPVKLSSLTGEERAHYESILQESLDDVRDMVAILPKGVSGMLHKAVTYHSDDNVYCAEDKVVITEWGMYPKGTPTFHTLALEKAKTPRFGPWANGHRVESETPAEPVIEVKEEPVSTPEVPVTEDQGVGVGYIPQETKKPEADEQQSDKKKSPDENPPVIPKDDGGKKKTKRRWLWLLLLIPLLLLLLLLRNCGGDGTRPLPPVSDENIIIGGDSISIVVDNRLLLLFEDGFTPKDFIRDFRALYPDKKKYQIYVPDQMLPRVELGCPSEERDLLTEQLPQQFETYGLIVLPESVVEGYRGFSDPAFSDADKSWYFGMINAEQAWDYTVGSKNVVVAVIDNFFDLNHPELRGKDIVKPYNAPAHSNKLSSVPTFLKGAGHGTHVASTAIGLADNGKGNSGIAPGCKLMPIQLANKNGIMTTTAIIDGVLYAIKNGADVVNMSFGASWSPLVLLLPESQQRSFIQSFGLEEQEMWRKIFAMGLRKDMAFVMAGGNDNQLIGMDPMNRIDGTILVSAVQPDKVKAGFSNYGERSTLSAPGVKIYNAVPGNGFDFMQGTSMASPVVAGAMALMKSQYPNLKTSQIVDILQKTGIPSPSRVGPIINLGAAMKLGENYRQPSRPGDPNNPSDPSNPGNPNNPNDPSNPNQPNDPNQPGQSQPIVGQPNDPNQPGQPQPIVGQPNQPGQGDCDDCDEARQRYEQLLRMIEDLKKQYPGCIGASDTLVIPVGMTIEQLVGRWMSTTPIYNNTDEEPVVIYFTFNGTTQGIVELIESNGEKFEAPISVGIKNDKIMIRQLQPATSLNGGGYEPYDFTIKPDKNRKADGMAVNQANAANRLRFSLVRIK